MPPLLKDDSTAFYAMLYSAIWVNPGPRSIIPARRVPGYPSRRPQPYSALSRGQGFTLEVPGYAGRIIATGSVRYLAGER